MSTAKIYLRDFAFLDESSRNTNDHASNPAELNDGDYLLIHFEELPESMQFKRIVGLPELFVYIKKLVDRDDPKYPYCVLYIDDIFHNFDATDATYNNCKKIIDSLKSSASKAGTYVKNTGWLQLGLGLTGLALNNGVAVKQSSIDATVSIPTTGTQRPYLSVEVDDSETVGVEVSGCAPASGSISKKQENKFSWKSSSSIMVSPKVTQERAVLRWRAGTDDVIHEVAVAGNVQSVTIPADTFDADEIQWQITVTANSGVVTTSEWMTLSTLDVKPEAKVISPQNTIVDATADSVFLWEHIITTGTAQSKADLQKSEDGSAWETLATITGPETQWICPAGTLTSSVKYWRVRTYNADSVASEWSDAAQIVVISAPPTPVIQIQAIGPRPAISWQTSGQQAAQLSIDGAYDSGTIYGVTQQWTAPMYLDDGNYTVRVRVQNEYGLWSEWGVAALQVINTPGAAISLAIRVSHIAELRWETTGSYDFYLVYRDGVPIAKTKQTSYTDAISIGPTQYQIRGGYTANGNYGISDVAAAEVIPATVMVEDLNNGTWIKLPYAATQNRKTSRERARIVSYLALSGIKFPVAEVSENYTDALTIEAACVNAEEKRKIEALIGQLVCVKTPEEDMVIGYMDILQKDHDGFVTTYAVTVQRINYDEEVAL